MIVGQVGRFVVFLCLAMSMSSRSMADKALSKKTIAESAEKVVKIYGAGGLRGLEAFQSGLLIDSKGHVLTVMSTVLDADQVDCVLDDGVRYRGTLIGVDPRRQIALLSLDADELPCFDLARTGRSPTVIGTRVFALSNLFGVAVGDERVSVQHGVVSAYVPLQARRGGYEIPFRGNVYIVDCTTNNPGSPGGALVDLEGHLIGMLGKELRASNSGLWLSYAIPVEELLESYDDIRSGTVSSPPPRNAFLFDPTILGLVLVPDLLNRTPPFIESVWVGSPAEKAGLIPDDLVVAVNGRVVQSRDAVQRALGLIETGDQVQITIVRQGEIIDVDLGPLPLLKDSSALRDTQDDIEKETKEDN